MINIIYCGYRTWSDNILESVSRLQNVTVVDAINDPELFMQKIHNLSEEIDLILFVGWSWMVPSDITEKHLCIGVHPSDLPYYRGGSPLQHQIIAGKTRTKVTLMTLSSGKLDAGDIWMKEDFDLSGSNMSEVFDNLVDSSIKLLSRFFEVYPDIVPDKQNTASGTYYKRRKPIDSKIETNQLCNVQLKNIYNQIRCLTDPYPNAYIEDDDGNKLYFQEVRYEEKKTKPNEA
jgi:methionyl-tRNA formyltransferase